MAKLTLFFLIVSSSRKRTDSSLFFLSILSPSILLVHLPWTVPYKAAFLNSCPSLVILHLLSQTAYPPDIAPLRAESWERVIVALLCSQPHTLPYFHKTLPSAYFISSYRSARKIYPQYFPKPNLSPRQTFSSFCLCVIYRLSPNPPILVVVLWIMPKSAHSWPSSAHSSQLWATVKIRELCFHTFFPSLSVP